MTAPAVAMPIWSLSREVVSLRSCALTEGFDVAIETADGRSLDTSSVAILICRREQLIWLLVVTREGISEDDVTEIARVHHVGEDSVVVVDPGDADTVAPFQAREILGGER